MRRPDRGDPVAYGGVDDLVEGPLEDPRTVLAEHMIGDRSLLDDIEIVYAPGGAAREADLAAAADDELVVERAAEAERLLCDRPTGEDTLTPESLEEVLEPFPTATDQTLHEVQPLLETLLDEGVPFDEADAEDFEAEIAGGAWRDYVD